MKSFIDLLQEVHGYTISHGTRIPVSTGDGVFSFPLKLCSLQYFLHLRNLKNKYFLSDEDYLWDSVAYYRDFGENSWETEPFSVAIQARNGNGSVPDHKHADCCEMLLVLMQSDEHGEPFIPDVSPIYYIGVGCEPQSHSWPENALLALSIKGSSFRQVREFASKDSVGVALTSALDSLAEER